jgi:hypothetical protein
MEMSKVRTYCMEFYRQADIDNLAKQFQKVGVAFYLLLVIPPSILNGELVDATYVYVYQHTKELYFEILT